MAESILEKINGDFKGKDIVSLAQFDPYDIKILFSHVGKMKKITQSNNVSHLLAGNIITLLFYEPSSRTFGSFSGAVKRLGGQTVEILNPQQFSSVAKGETFEDTIRTFEAYSDAVVIRHPEKGAAKYAADAAKFVPIINAGDGIGEHPTQALLDLYTIYEKHKRLNNLIGVMAGDIINGRTVHSLIHGLSLFKKNTLYLLAPYELRLSRSDFNNFTKRGVKLVEIESEKELPKNAHFWYWTRVQKERFENATAYKKVKDKFIVNKKLLKDYANMNMILMHPLPRISEIEKNVDNDPRAVYLTTQIRNGLYIRMALIGLVLGKL